MLKPEILRSEVVQSLGDRPGGVLPHPTIHLSGIPLPLRTAVTDWIVNRFVVFIYSITTGMCACPNESINSALKAFSFQEHGPANLQDVKHDAHAFCECIVEYGQLSFKDV